MLVHCYHYSHYRPSDKNTKKTIYISDILPKGGPSIVNCGSIHAVGGSRKHSNSSTIQRGREVAKFPISVPVITHPPQVQPDGDYWYGIHTRV